MAKDIHTGLSVFGLSGDAQTLLIKGTTNDTSKNALEVTNSDDDTIIYARNDGAIVFNGDGGTGNFRLQGNVASSSVGNSFYGLHFDSTRGKVGIGTPISFSGWPDGKLDITGENESNANCALVVRNAGAVGNNIIMDVRNDGVVIFNRDGLNNGDVVFWDADSNPILRTDVATSSVGVGLDSPSSRLHIKGAGDTSSTDALRIQDSADTQTFAVKDDGSVVVGSETLKVIQEATITLNGIQIGNLNSSPQEIVAAPPAGKAIQVVSASYKSVFDTAAFATNTKMRLISAASPQYITDIGHTTSVIQSFNAEDQGVDLVSLADGAALDVDVSVGNPTGGAAGSSITITVQYVIIDVS